MELYPHDMTRNMALSLFRHGLCHSGFHTALYGHMSEIITASSHNILVREVEKSELDLFAGIYTDAYTPESGEPSPFDVDYGNSLKALYNRDNWKMYLAFVDGVAASCCLLYIRDQMSVLSGAFTVKAHRRKGCQMAMLQKRILDASVAGCDLVVSQASFNSTSHTNMEKIGMKVAYTYGLWSEAGPYA